MAPTLTQTLAVADWQAVEDKYWPFPAPCQLNPSPPTNNINTVTHLLPQHPSFISSTKQPQKLIRQHPITTQPPSTLILLTPILFSQTTNSQHVLQQRPLQRLRLGQQAESPLHQRQRLLDPTSQDHDREMRLRWLHQTHLPRIPERQGLQRRQGPRWRQRTQRSSLLGTSPVKDCAEQPRSRARERVARAEVREEELTSRGDDREKVQEMSKKILRCRRRTWNGVLL